MGRPGTRDGLAIGGKRGVGLGDDRSLVAQGDLCRRLPARLRDLDGRGIAEQRRSKQVHRQQPDIVPLVPQIARSQRHGRILPRDLQLHLGVCSRELQQPLAHVHTIAQCLAARIALAERVGQRIEPGKVELQRAHRLDRHAQRGRQLSHRACRRSLLDRKLTLRLVQPQPRGGDLGRGGVTGLEAPLQQRDERAPRLQLSLQQRHAFLRRLQLHHPRTHLAAHSPCGAADFELRRLRQVLRALHDSLLPRAPRQAVSPARSPGSRGCPSSPASGCGTRLPVSLPRASAAAPAAPAPWPHWRAHARPPGRGGSRTPAESARPAPSAAPASRDSGWPWESMYAFSPGVVGAALQVSGRGGLGVDRGRLIALQGAGGQQHGQCSTGERSALLPLFL